MYNEHTTQSATRSQAINELATSLAKAQGELKNPGLDSVNPHFRNKYASLPSILSGIRPVLAKHGLCITQHLAGANGGISCTTILLHTSGQFIESTLTLPAQKADAQGLGSASTYARRYAIQAVLGISGDDDDDGEAASKQPATASKAPPREPDPEVDAALEAIALCDDLEALNQMTGVLKELSDASNDNRTRLGTAFVARKKALEARSHG